MTVPVDGGQITYRFNIVNITNADPCTIYTDVEHGMTTGDFVRLTNLNGAMPIPHGSDPLNNYRFRIVVTGLNQFYITYPVTGKKVDSTNFTPYVTGGSCNKIEQTYFYYPSVEDLEIDMANEVVS